MAKGSHSLACVQFAVYHMSFLLPIHHILSQLLTAQQCILQDGDARKVRRGPPVPGGGLSTGLVRKQKGAGFLRRESSGISAAKVCGNSLGTLIQALQAHEHKVSTVTCERTWLGDQDLKCQLSCFKERERERGSLRLLCWFFSSP